MGLGRKIVGGLAAGGIAIFAGTSATEDKTTRDQAGAITEAGGLGAFAVRIGDCLQLPDGTQVVSVEGVPCAEPHDGQVYAEFAVSPAPSFPGDAAMQSQSEQGCIDRWPAAFGVTYENDAAHELYYMSPSAESWATDDREVTCVVTTADGSPLVGSKLAG
ncbi:MAG TPA: septum formation family protein [Acidimicrobiia bacterium]|nr:septum formation family protein [Acidimicrobiia bacterium]